MHLYQTLSPISRISVLSQQNSASFADFETRYYTPLCTSPLIPEIMVISPANIVRLVFPIQTLYWGKDDSTEGAMSIDGSGS